MINRLDIRLFHRFGEKRRRGLFNRRMRVGRTERYTTDFVVDGLSLFSHFKYDDLCGAFSAKQDEFFQGGRSNREAEVNFLNVEGEARRIALYVCPECGDPWCGAATCDVARVEGIVVWSRFSYECGYINDGKPDYSTYADIGPFEFDATEYDAVIRRAARGEV